MDLIELSPVGGHPASNLLGRQADLQVFGVFVGSGRGSRDWVVARIAGRVGLAARGESQSAKVIDQSMSNKGMVTKKRARLGNSRRAPQDQVNRAPKRGQMVTESVKETKEPSESTLQCPWFADSEAAAHHEPKVEA